MSKPTLFTIVGTRPEIIRLSRLIPKFDAEFNHILIHTGQNFDKKLNDVFFEELKIRKPDYFLGVHSSSLAHVMGEVLVKTEELINLHMPQGVFILGDTNSSIAAVIAKRMQIAVYHWEAGNRSFDENVPEETNRRIIDHVAHFNIAYSKNAYQNLLREGLSSSRLLLSGSPMKEVLDFYSRDISKSNILESLQLKPGEYFLASIHRQENVDSKTRLRMLIDSLELVSTTWKLPVLISTHPRTRAKLREFGISSVNENIIFHEPFGFLGYMKLQMNAKCVISDSGTISEESAIAGFPAITARDSMERQEALEAGTIRMTGLEPGSIIDGIHWSLENRSRIAPEDYLVSDSSQRVLDLVRETISDFQNWSGVRKLHGNVQI